MTAACLANDAVVYLVVVVDVEGVRCRALLDTGAGSSYASGTLLDRIDVRPGRRQVRKIEMILGVATREVELTSVSVSNLAGNFQLAVEVTRADKAALLELENPRYLKNTGRYTHFNGVKMLDEDAKTALPAHIILGASEIAKINTDQAPRVGSPGEPLAEVTRFGWTIMTPGEELISLNLTQTSRVEHEDLYRLDVLGLKEPAVGDQEQVYNELKEQFQRSSEGW